MEPLFFAVLASLCLVSLCGCWLFAIEIRRTVLEIRAAHDQYRAAKGLKGDVLALQEQADALEAALKRLNARVGMRETREKRAGGSPGEPEEPDMNRDPVGYAAYWERKLGIGLGRPPSKRNN